jgi:ribosome-associated toxin RatA of RatAB toxin-antitoxin module
MSVSGEQEFSTEVTASMEQCFATITAFEQYPDWFASIEETRVLDRHPDGLAKRVEFYIDMTLKTIRYVLEYHYEKPTRLTWKAVDGDLEAIEGDYVFEKLGPRRSRVTCRQSVSLGFWVPGPIRTLLERQALQQSVLEFKAAAEAAAKKPATRGRAKKS